MLAVALSLLALGIGPLLGPLLQRFRAVAAALDGFVVVAVTGLVVLHVLPQSVELAGPPALILAAIGLLVPALLHRLDARQQPAAVRGSRAVVTTTILLGAAFAHALLDGTALISGHEHGHAAGAEGAEEGGVSFLALAVLLHRIPYGLALWLVGRERLGLPVTLAVLGALAGGTVAGALVGDALVTTQTAGGFALVQAFAAGAILHVLLDAPPVDVTASKKSSLVGVAGGIGVLLLLLRSHPFLSTVAGELSFSSTLQGLFTRAAPALVIAFVLAAAVNRAPALPLVNVVAGVVAGGFRAFCSCSVVPVFEALVRRRAPLAAATAFLVVAPEVSAPSLFLSAELLGLPFTLARVAGAVVLGVVAGLVLQTQQQKTEEEAAASALPSLPAAGFFSAVDHLGPWLVAGFVVAAFLEPLLARDTLAQVPRALEVPAYALVGIPFYTCGTGATPVAAVLLHKGASPGAVTALLLAAPATHVATLGFLSRALSAKAAAVFAFCAFAVACCAGFAVNSFELVVPPLHLAASSSLSTGAAIDVSRIFALALGAVLLVSLLRQGARGFLGQIVHPIDDAKGGHVHGPHCGHPEHKAPGFLKKAPIAKVSIDFTP